MKTGKMHKMMCTSVTPMNEMMVVKLLPLMKVKTASDDHCK